MQNPTVTVTNLDIGSCIVYHDGDELGATLSNVTVKMKYEKAPLMADQFGKTLLDEAVNGIEVTIETEIAEVRDKEKLAKIFPNATLKTLLTQKALVWENKVTTRSLPLAKTLKLHPIREESSSKDFDYVFWKVIASEDSQYVFGPSEQGKFKVVWKVLLDTSTTPPRMFTHGDPAV